MNPAIDHLADIVIGPASFLAMACGAVVFALLGRERIPPYPCYALGLAVSFIYTVLATKGMNPQGASDEGLVFLRVLSTLFYTAFLVIVYWIARTKSKNSFRSGPAKISPAMRVRKQAGKSKVDFRPLPPPIVKKPVRETSGGPKLR